MSKINIAYTTINRDSQSWSSGDVIFNLTTSTLQEYNGSVWNDVASGSGGSLTASNGLTLAANDVKLGGTLIENTLIHNGVFEFAIDSYDTQINLGSQISVRSDFIGISNTNGGFWVGAPGLSIDIQPGISATVNDNRDVGQQKGLEYVADYSADFTARSLVDKGYVDSLSSTGVYNVIQTTRRTIGSPSGYYPIIANSTTSNLQYIGIDYPEVALKDTTSLVDLWIQRLAPPITSAATTVTATTATLNWALDTYWNGTSFVITPSSSYIIEYSTSSTFASGVTTVTGTATTYPVTGLTTATTYYYRVKVVNGDKISTVSNTTNFTTA